MADVAAFLRRARPRSLDEARAFADPARVRTLLVVKSHDQLGDLLVAAPAVAALRARYPSARIVLVTRPYLAPLARRLPGPDDTWCVPSVQAPVHFVHVVRSVRALAPNIAFVLNSVSRSGTADVVAALSRASLVVGRSTVGAGPGTPGAAPRPGERVYDLDVPVAAASVHQVDRVLDLVRWTGAEATGPARLVLRDDERATGASDLRAALGDITASGPVVGLHPAAANPLKCWPVDAFADLAARLAAAGARIVVFDTPKEPGPAGAIVAALQARGVSAGLWPAGPLDALLAPCAALDLMICNDSGVMHVAAALGAPVLSFHSLGRPEEWAPRSATALALHAERIVDIAVDDAERAARRLLAARAGGS